MESMFTRTHQVITRRVKFLTGSSLLNVLLCHHFRIKAHLTADIKKRENVRTLNDDRTTSVFSCYLCVVTLIVKQEAIPAIVPLGGNGSEILTLLLFDCRTSYWRDHQVQPGRGHWAQQHCGSDVFLQRILPQLRLDQQNQSAHCWRQADQDRGGQNQKSTEETMLNSNCWNNRVDIRRRPSLFRSTLLFDLNFFSYALKLIVMSQKKNLNVTCILWPMIF